MKYLLLLPSILLINLIAKAQLAIVYDTDGYSNVRKSASLKSTVIGKISENQVFCISPFDEEKNKEWINVWYQPKPDLKFKHFIRFDETPMSGFVHKSRVIFLEQLQELTPIVSDSTKFTFKNSSIEIFFEVQPYPKGAKPSLKIDRSIWGVYGNNAKKEIKSISLKTAKGIYYLLNEAIDKLYEINIEQTKVYLGKKHEFYITTTGADGADSYQIAWCIKNEKLHSMTVTQTIP